MSREVSVAGLVVPALPEGFRFSVKHSEPDVWPPYPTGVILSASIESQYRTLWWQSWGRDESMPRYLIDLRQGVEAANETLAAMADSAFEIVKARSLVA